MRTGMQWLLGAVLLIVSAVPASAQSPAMRARIDGTVAAFNGTAEEFEAYVQEAYAPALRERATAGERKAFLDRVRADFGKLEMTAVRRVDPTHVSIAVKGSTGTRGTITIEHETAEPHRLTDLRFRLGEDEGERPALPPVPVKGTMSAADLTKALDGYVAALVKSDAFAGSVLVARDGKPLFEKAYGLANRSDNVPNTTATRFSIGSINKHFTRTAVGQLVAAGKLSLSDTIGTHIPDYANAEARKATIAQLVGMQGGLADIFSPEFTAAGKQRFRSNRDYFEFVAPKPLLFPPGTERRYCNSCYVVLGEIVERVSGMPYEKYVAEHVLKPAGMQTAAFIDSDEIAPNVAVGYTKRMGAGLRSNVLGRGAGGSAAGSAFATARDLLALDEALRNGRLLDPQRTAWFYELDAPPTGRVKASAGYAGGSPGCNATVESGPEWTVVVLANLDPPSAESLAGAIYRALAPE
jgi:D-alanyl-D-alanine carboxypeptidase